MPIENNQAPQSQDNPLTGTQAFVEAQIQVSEVPPDDNDGVFVGDAYSASIWTDYIVKNRYENDLHRYMMTITSPGNGVANASPGLGNALTVLAGAAFVQLGAPTLLWISDWTASRFREKPTVPQPEPPAGSPWVLLDKHYETMTLNVAPDGVTPLYRINGTFVYGHKNPSEETVLNINFSRPPWMADVFDRSVSSADQARNIIGIFGF